MMRFIRRLRCSDCPYAANGMAVFIALFSIFFLHLESSPRPAGADIARRPSKPQTFVIASLQRDVAATSKESAVAQAELTPEQRHEKQLKFKIQLIEKGLDFLGKTPDYTAQFVKQELVRGDLLDEQEMEIKVRHQPFSIYLKWVTGEAGREVLYVDGQNNGRMTAHGGGWKSRAASRRLARTFHQQSGDGGVPTSRDEEPDCINWLKRCWNITGPIWKQKRFSRCERLPEQTFDGRPCYVFLIEYADPESVGAVSQVDFADRQGMVDSGLHTQFWMVERRSTVRP